MRTCLFFWGVVISMFLGLIGYNWYLKNYNPSEIIGIGLAIIGCAGMLAGWISIFNRFVKGK